MRIPYVIKETKDYYSLSTLCNELGLKIDISETPPAGTIKMWRLENSETEELMAVVTLQTRENVYVLGQLAVKPEYQKQGYGKILQKMVFDEARKMGVKELWGSAKIPEYYYQFGWEKMDWDTSPKVVVRCNDCGSRGKLVFRNPSDYAVNMYK